MNADEIRATIRRVFDEEARIPAAERGTREVEQAYRDGMLRIVSALGFMDAVTEPGAAPTDQHPAWCTRGPRCTSDVRTGERPEHRSESWIVPTDPAADTEYRVTLTQAGGGPVLVEVDAGLPDAFDETGTRLDASLAQARHLAEILADLAAEGGGAR